MKTAIIAIFSFFTFTSGVVQTEVIHFDVLFEDNKIGHFIATESHTGKQLVRDLKTKSSTTIIAISVHVETEATITRTDGVLTEGVAYRNANRGVENVYAKTKRIGNNKYQVNRNGKTLIKENYEISWCVTDLFFKEPKNLNWIYSNMLGQKLKINHLGNGRYHVVSPENDGILYTYKAGQLIMTETNTPIGKIVSKRK